MLMFGVRPGRLALVAVLMAARTGTFKPQVAAIESNARDDDERVHYAVADT